QFTARNLSIKNNSTSKSWETNSMSANIQYINDEGHWSIAVADLYFGDESRYAWPESANIIASDDGENYYLSADFLRVGDLQEIAQIFLDKEKLSDFNKLKAYKIQADIYNLSLQLPKRSSGQKFLDELYLQVSVNDFSLHDKANDIDLSGLDTTLIFENGQAVLDLASHHTKVELPKLFRDPLFVNTLHGKITLADNGVGWRLSGDQLQLKNEHINTFTRLDVQFSTLENIFVDVQTDFYDAYGKNARYYLPVGVMSPSLVDWLDMAVTDGYVRSGQFVLHGDLNSFPYDDGEGVFQILFAAENIDMRYLQDWPSITDASATIKFENRSLVVKDASAKTQGADLFNGHAEIPDLPDSHLTVRTDAHGRNEDVQSYIWESPLDDVLGDAMRLFQFSGDSALNLTIDVPLNKDDIEAAIDGHLKFNNTQIYYPALGYEINNINGVVDFTKDSIFADSMPAKIQDETVAINAFTQNGKSGREVVFHLDGQMQADYLLQRYDWIPQGWVSGRSMWSLDVEVPYRPDDYLVHVKANSYLEGVTFQLSDKVHKSSAGKVDFSAAIDVLDENGLHVDAKAELVGTDDVVPENIFSLYAIRDDNDLWEFDIDSQYMAGKGEFTEGLGRDTQVKLDLENIDLHALFFTEDNKDSEPLIPNDFPPLSWRFGRLLWDDWEFTNVVLETDWHKHGMLINKFSLKGPAMNFGARGTWLKSWTGTQETVLQGSMNSRNLGTTLTGLGFQRSIDRASYKATFNAKWGAPPYGFSWENMKGKTSFEMENGEIIEVDPGAGGRLLGLLNIFKLASRLAFDFDDVTRKGFSFDYIKGEFDFVHGDGSLKKFDVSAPAADVNIFGSIGLIKRDYGLLMRVKP
ncbi:MAG: hypothetical protein DRQ44_17705, partial [Gammaproteobacteria bacterium]